MNKLGFLQISHDIAMNIGLHQNINSEIKSVLKALSNRLNARGVVLFIREDIQSLYDFKDPYISIPFKVVEKPSFKNIPVEKDDTFLQIDETSFLYQFHLPSIGKISILKSHAFEEYEVKTLENLFTKIDTSFASCLNYLQLEIEKKKSDIANKAKSLFLANMSHEIRTPLNAIIAITSLIIKQGPEKNHSDKISKIKTSSDALISLVNDILDFSKIEAGELSLENIRCHFGDTIRDSVNIFEHIVEEKNVTMVCSIDDNLNDFYNFDPTRLRQVITNLISNAIKFTESGSIHVRANLQKNENSQLTTRIEIQDSGIGIPEEKQAGLFQPFTQADFSTTRQYGGTGLGLSICKEIIQCMNGHIGVQSQTNQGSTFYFEIPLYPDTTPQAEILKIEEQEKEKEKSNIKILVVEDNQMNRDVMEMLLSSLEQEYDFAENGLEGYEKFKEKEYDLILMDCQMPILDGFQSTINIRKHEHEHETYQTPIVAMTANALAKDKDYCFEIGMNDYLTKPVTFDTVKDIVQKYSQISEKHLLKQKTTSHKSNQTSETFFSPEAMILLQSLNYEKKPNFLNKFLLSFLIDLSDCLETISTALSHKDFQKISLSALHFRTSCGIVGAQELQKTCLSLEESAKIQDIEKCQSIIKKIEQEKSLITTYIKSKYDIEI